MGSKVDDNKFSWLIINFNSLQSEKINSDLFTIGGCQWYLTAYPNGDNVDYLSLFIAVAKYELLPFGWKRHAKVSFTVVNKLSESLSQKQELQKLFDEKTPSWGFEVMLPLSLLRHKDSGFLVNGELNILAEIDVLLAIGHESEEAAQLLEETVEVYGFRVLSSQVESVKCIFESYPDIASQVGTKNHHLKSTYINVLLGIMDTLCQSPEELTDDDLREASVAVSYVANAGFKVDWLEEKLYQVLEKKNRVQCGEAWLLIVNEECSNLKVLLEKEKAEVAAAKIPLSFDDFL